MVGTVVRGSFDKGQVIEEPCKAKVLRTVLKTNGSGDRFVEFNDNATRTRIVVIPFYGTVAIVANGTRD
ncbi:MAG: hypothetical protein EA343_20490 [Nodularia sp. (in: Bacteria)]|nr:MAG: hypothetical protein EA343_20490 [Nodularia sp. (in: cyanobacteria)]